MGGGARSAPFCMLMSLKKTGALSARARMRGQNPTSFVYYLILLHKLPGPTQAVLLRTPAVQKIITMKRNYIMRLFSFKIFLKNGNFEENTV
jgi:hypothetical protein